MCSLKIREVKCDNSLWGIYQKSQLERLSIKGARAAFPGSLLCNHILVPDSAERIFTQQSFELPDVSAVVYEYCSTTERHECLVGSLLVDLQPDLDEEWVTTAVFNHIKNESVERVVILGNAAHNAYGELLRVKSGISVSVLEPDWMSAVALHSIYRQAISVLFINSMRVIDAAITGCRCSLVVGSCMLNEPAFGILQRYLHSVGCRLYDDSGRLISLVNADPSSFATVDGPYILIENSHSALQKVQNPMLGDSPDDRMDDWMSEWSSEEQLPIIKPYSSYKTLLFKRMYDRKILFSRKLGKLWDNPGGFFADSKLKPLRFIGRLFC